MEYEQIKYAAKDGILTITLNRPDKLNAFTGKMLSELLDAMDRADRDDDVRAVVFTGAGRGFCAGADLSGGANTFNAENRGPVDPGLDGHRDGGGLLTLRLYDSLKPTIAACNGPAVGVGVTMQLAMDLRLASEAARYGFVFTRRAIVMEACSSWFLPRLVGPQQALEWVMTGRVFSAEEALRGRLVRSIHAPHDLLPAAHALARHRAGPVLVVAEAATGDVLAELPVAALRLPAGLAAALARLGLTRIGELADQPRAPLALRFGPEPGRRLDQAHGRLPEPWVAVVPPELPRVRQGFAEPIGTPEALAQAIARLVPALCAHLEARGQGARRLDLLLHRVDRRIEAIRVGLALPVREPKQLTRLLLDRLATIDPGLGIELMVLTAVSVDPLRYRPAATALGEVRRPDIADLIDLLAGRIGAARLYRYAAVASDLPERSVRKVAPLAEPGGQGWPSHGPRPVRLLPVPEPIGTLALLPDHAPAQFTWRGRRHRVRRADGPERVFGEWWRNDAELASVRDYFQVETETGARFWLFRAGDGVDATTGTQRWFLHGVFG